MFKTSVLLVCYNHEPFIAQCVESILMQSMTFDFEIVVADDCSTDRTLSIIQEYSKGSKIPFRFLPLSVNLGMAKNYQRGFNACTGEYIAVIEGDDYWVNSHRLEKHVSFLEEHKECVMSHDRKIRFLQDSGRFELDDQVIEKESYYLTAQKLASGNCLGTFSACVYRQSILSKLKPDLFDLEIADWMINMSVAQFGLIGVLGEVMTVYRIHRGGTWSKMNRIARLEKEKHVAGIYNEYFNFKYDSEFKSLQKYIDDELAKIKNREKKSFKKRILDYSPPLFMHLIKLLIPPALRKG